MKKYKKGFTLTELIIAVSLLIILFIALYDLYMKNLVIYKDNKTKAEIEMDVKNFSDSLYSYLKGSYQDSIKVTNDKKTLSMNLPIENLQESLEFTEKDDYIEVISKQEEESKVTRALEGYTKSFTLEPIYNGGVLTKLKIIIEYEFRREKTERIFLDYTIRN